MRVLLAVFAVSSLGGCAFMPAHDPNQAWIDLHTNPASQLRAAEVDDKPLDDDRFFQVEPGSHELQARLSFAVDGSDVGPGSPALPRNCQVRLKYAEFAAGQRYRLVAGNIGFRPWAKLYDERNQVLAKGREGRCGEF
ncbi:hypothetical protein NVV93_00195 [Pseudomonas sp. LS44]|uniref:PA0061/PA0062 family lipoprotein n=1 Tax=Pseudomonas sp. LS44 TaxID=1357074 RepID=UPI00215AE17F|nr:hypothetical protein [Pseudomonas sp. LS44]UVE17857.1 hypothetical protein NVV93_00195 [Pseudomonas sp. LS44]